MSPHNLFIDANTGAVTATPTGGTPSIKVLLGARLTLNCAFHVNGTIAAISNYTSSSLRIAVKKSDDIDSATSLLGLGTWNVTGSGTSTRYVLTVEADSEQLQTAIGDLPEITTRAQLTWEISGQDEPRLSFPFDLTFVNSPARTDDGAPDTTGTAGYAWLIARILAGAGISITGDSGAQTLTLAAARTFGRTTTDTALSDTAWTTLHTIPVEANATYRLEILPIATVPDSRYLRLTGEIPSGAAAHGLWHTLDTAGLQSVPPYAFTATSGDELLTNQSGATATLHAPVQSFLIITGVTAGNITLKARLGFSTASGTYKAGSHYILTKLT